MRGREPRGMVRNSVALLSHSLYGHLGQESGCHLALYTKSTSLRRLRLSTVFRRGGPPGQLARRRRHVSEEGQSSLIRAAFKNLPTPRGMRRGTAAPLTLQETADSRWRANRSRRAGVTSCYPYPEASGLGITWQDHSLLSLLRPREWESEMPRLRRRRRAGRRVRGKRFRERRVGEERLVGERVEKRDQVSAFLAA